MRYLYLFILFLPFIGYSQQFTYKGTISDKGLPLPGASICVQGTQNCTQSDLDGNYSIRVKTGDILVISFVGMATKTIKVGNPDLKSGVYEEVKPIKSDDFANLLEHEKDTVQISVASGTTNYKPTYNNYLHALALISKDKNDVYTMKYKRDYAKLYLELYHEFVTGVPMRLPQLQSRYAQGRSINNEAAYQSPETGEIFSWGPAVSTLETSDTPTAYYPNGNIVALGAGNGNAAPLYNRNSFYRNTFEQKTNAVARLVIDNVDLLKLTLGYRTNNGTLPTAKNNEISSALAFNKNTNHHKLSANLSYNRSENNLSNANFIYNKAIFANAITPAHFNNGAGKLLPNGQPRSYSSLENNPYYLLGYDHDGNTATQAGLALNDIYSSGDNENTVNVVAQLSDTKLTGGNIPFAAQVTDPMYTVRKEKYNMVSAYDAFNHEFEYKKSLGLRLGTTYQERQLNRLYSNGYTSLEDYPGNAITQYNLKNNQNRFETTLTANGEFNIEDIISYYDYLVLEGSAGLTYSSTVKGDVYGNASFGFVWNQLIDRSISLFGNTSYKQYEPGLQNNNLYFNSLRFATSQFKQMDNNMELFTPNTTTLTRENNYTTGVRYNGRVYGELELYYKKVHDMYAPVFNGTTYNWQPAVDYYQRGLELSLNYTLPQQIYGKGFGYTVNTTFTTYKNKVTAIAGGGSRIPIAGFADVNKNYMVGKPLGTIVGSAYKRDAYNNVIIDASGYPEVADEPAAIANPNPDFVVGLNNTFNYRKFSMGLNFDWSQGGQLWNGTQQTLNYYGVSAVTAAQRNVTGYVFNGVTTSGQANTQPVSFYDTTQSVSQNRWVRYGVAGVAESAIEDATYFRLNNVTLSYTNNLNYYTETLTYTVTAFMNNVFVASRSRAFASNTMFNSAETAGLDYFNAPMLRMYGLSVSVKF